jgi:flagellar basal-body rod protein FlgC
MTDYFSSFEISATGLMAEKLKLEAVAMNIANANTTAPSGTAPYQPMRVVTRPMGIGDFGHHLQRAGSIFPGGVQTVGLEPIPVQPRMIFDPHHPDADANGFVAHASVDPLSEMVSMTAAVRAYEANIKAISAARVMAQKALEIGGNR